VNGPDQPTPRPAGARPPIMMPEEAWDLLREWLPANDDPDRPVVTLATVDAAGEPDARTLLLSEFDREGLYVHTDSASRKVGQLTAHPAVAVVARWPEQLRQLVVRGRAEQASPEEMDRAYLRRSPYLQQLAWLNTPDVARLPEQDRRSRWAEFSAAHPQGTLRPPATWRGFLIRPTSLTFWTGDAEAASHRRELRLVAGRWISEDLPG